MSDASISFGKPQHTDKVSYIVENDLLLAAVGEEAAKCDNLKVQYDAKVKDYQLPDFHGKVSSITLENGQQYTCDLLVRFILSLNVVTLLNYLH